LIRLTDRNYRIGQKQKKYKLVSIINERKSAASFCHWVAALVSDMFCNFYVVKNHKMATYSATMKAREKISTDLESLEF
jgi:hypothetical protein